MQTRVKDGLDVWLMYADFFTNDRKNTVGISFREIASSSPLASPGWLREQWIPDLISKGCQVILLLP